MAEITQEARVRFDGPEVEEEEHQSSFPTEQRIVNNFKNALGLSEEPQAKPPESNEPGPTAHVMKTLLGLPFYPLKVARVLIQLGYEPKPPERRYSFIFQEYLYYYPGIIGYTRAIARESGWRALFRGVGCHIVEELVASSSRAVITSAVEHAVGDTEKSEETFRDVMIRTINLFITKLISELSVTVIVHPFHVITVRNIAQHIGNEHVYNGFFSSVREIYRTEGLGGFYSGLVPALWASYQTVCLYTVIWCATEMVMVALAGDRYNLPKLFFKGIVAFPLIMYVPVTYPYPYSMVSNVMAVNNTPLAAGRPPRMPIFSGWSDCVQHFKTTGNAFRGSGIIFPRFVYKNPPKAL